MPVLIGKSRPIVVRRRVTTAVGPQTRTFEWGILFGTPPARGGAHQLEARRRLARMQVGWRLRSRVRSSTIGAATPTFVCILAVAALVAVPPFASAQPAVSLKDPIRATLDDALRAYRLGVDKLRDEPDGALEEFRRARDGLQTVVDSGVLNGRLQYDLGNAHLRLGEVGKAIAHYRMAERLIPGDENLTANLRFARSMRRDQIESSGDRTFLKTVFFLHYEWPLRMRLALAMVGYGVFWGLMIVRRSWSRPGVAGAAWVALALWISFGASAGLTAYERRTPSEGVLVTKDVIVRKGNGESYDPQFAAPLNEGVEFTVLEVRSNWVHIELPDGSRGWIRDRDAIVF